MGSPKLYIYLLKLLIILNVSEVSPAMRERVHNKDRLNTTELVREFGLDCEEVEAITEDGYILTLFHVLSPTVSHELPILLLHGLMDSSDTYCIRRKNSLAANLTESGYDVWLANSRGNRYSRRHVSLDPDKDKDYWDYSFHEIGNKDYTATIDKVLERTGKPQLIAIGHSQGTLNFFVMSSSSPDYNAKVKLFIALAPIFFSQNYRGLATSAPLTFPLLHDIFSANGQTEILGPNSQLLKKLKDMCTRYKLRSYKICLYGLFFSVFGGDPEQIELEFLPVIMKQYLAGGASLKLVAHAEQMIHGHFGEYDYGPERNLEKYGSPKAPIYNLTNISTKVVLMVGRNDYVGTVQDSARLRDALPNVIYFEMPRDTFSHLDFVWGNQMSKYFFPYLHRVLDETK